MARGGKRDGAGRKPGSISQTTASKRRTLSELAKAHSAVALKALVDVAKGGVSESARVAAANALLDRAYGKPSQSVQHSGAIGSYDLTKVTDDDLDRLEAILGPLADTGGDPGGAET